MKQNTKRALNNIVETYLTSVISNSITIARHSKRPRRTIQSSDILAALKIEGTPLILPTNAGYTDNTPVDLNKFLNDGINGSDNNNDFDDDEDDNHNTNENGNGSSDSTSTVPSTTAPSEMGMVVHWLAVEGKQPMTHLNPLSILKQQRQKEMEERERRNKNENMNNGDRDSGDSTAASGDMYANNDESNVAVWDLLPHLLSEELQLYFTRIAYALQRGDAKAQDAALLRLRYDSGIQELVPFFLSFLTPTNNAQMANVQQSLLRIQCIRNLILNPNVHLELHLHQVVPLVLNCIVPRKLSTGPYDHWKLRDEASLTLLSVWNVFGEKYAVFQPGVIRQLCKALGHGLESRYGALVALSDLGPKVVDSFVLPVVGKFWTDCEEQLKKCTDDGGLRFSLYRLQDALLVRPISISFSKDAFDHCCSFNFDFSLLIFITNCNKISTVHNVCVFRVWHCTAV